MIRAALITIAFLGVTLSLILMQPASKPSAWVEVSEPQTEPPAEPDSTVSRAETDLDALEALPETPGVTAAVSSLTPAPQAPANLPRPEAVLEPDEAPLPEIVASVAPLPVLPAAVPHSEPATELERLIINALAQGQSEGYIDALVNDAARKGKVEVPTSLVMADGRVDTGSLLAVLSQPPKPEFGPGSSYVVQPGDSLASIAYRFYGSTGKAADIFVANRAILASPNDVETGQSLALPEL